MTTSHHTSLRVAIVGGSGKVARELIAQLHARGDEAVAIFRNADRADEISGWGAIPVVIDIESTSVAELTQALTGANVVVFSAGAGGGDPERTRAVDFDGAVLAMDAASAAGVSRFVMVSAMGAGDPVPSEGDMVAYYRSKHDADLHLMATDLRWTILRPGALTDDPATGKIRIAAKVERGSVARADVAAVIVATIDDPNTIGAAWEFTSGSQAIVDAIGSGE